MQGSICEGAMAKGKKVPNILIDDGLAILGQLARQGLLDKKSPQRTEAAIEAQAGRDSGETPRTPSNFTGL